MAEIFTTDIVKKTHLQEETLQYLTTNYQLNLQASNVHRYHIYKSCCDSFETTSMYNPNLRKLQVGLRYQNAKIGRKYSSTLNESPSVIVLRAKINPVVGFHTLMAQWRGRSIFSLEFTEDPNLHLFIIVKLSNQHCC